MTFLNGPVATIELICNIVVVFKPKKAIKNVISSCSSVIGSGIREYVAHNGVLVLLFEVVKPTNNSDDNSYLLRSRVLTFYGSIIVNPSRMSFDF